MRLLALTIASLLLVAPAFAADRYVSTGGTDLACTGGSNDGTPCVISGECTGGGTCTGDNDCTTSSPAQDRCATIAHCIDQMVDGDTCYIGDGTYTEVDSTGAANCSDGQIVIPNDTPSSSGCPSGCTLRAENIDADSPNVVLTGTATFGQCVGDDSPGWTISGFKHQNVSNALTAYTFPAATPLTFTDSVFEYTNTGTGQAVRIWNFYDVTISRITTTNTGITCISDGTEPACIEFIASSVGDLAGYTVEDSSFRACGGKIIGSDNGDGISNLTVRRNTFEHPMEHGILTSGGNSNWLIENNVFKGDPDCVSTCTDQAACVLTGPRTLDIYEHNGLVFRNNTIVGHGYNFEDGPLTFRQTAEVNAGCDGFAAANFCERDNVFIYNNAFYDLAVAGDDASFIDLIEDGPTDNGTNTYIQIDGNYYSSNTDVSAPFVITPTSDGCDGTKATWDTDWKNCSAWGGTNNIDPNSDYDSTLASASALFVNYSGEDYTPAASGLLRDTGQDGTDTSISCTVDTDCPGDGHTTCSGGFCQIAKCATDDYNGNTRTDGTCDIGAIESFAAAATGTPQPQAGYTIKGGKIPG